MLWSTNGITSRDLATRRARLGGYFDYSLAEHGVAQAVKYVSSFDDIFESLSVHPTLGRERSEIRQGLRSLAQEYHIVFYRLREDRIRIIRILHGSRDLPQQFTDI